MTVFQRMLPDIRLPAWRKPCKGFSPGLLMKGIRPKFYQLRHQFANRISCAKPSQSNGYMWIIWERQHMLYTTKTQLASAYGQARKPFRITSTTWHESLCYLSVNALLVVSWHVVKTEMGWVPMVFDWMTVETILNCKTWLRKLTLLIQVQRKY